MVVASVHEYHPLTFLSFSRQTLTEGPAFCLPTFAAAAAAAAAGGDAEATGAAAAEVLLIQRPLLTEPLWLTQGKINSVWYVL